jgi:hypothetical protein
MVVPALDGIAAAAFALGGVAAAISIAGQDDGDEAPLLSVLAIGFSVGAVFTGAAVVGAGRARRCSRAIETWHVAAGNPADAPAMTSR